MTLRVGLRFLLALSACVLVLDVPDRMVSASPQDSRLPFSTPPERLPGPPRASGDLPEGRGFPPSTMPGQRYGDPPRATGVAPPSTTRRPQPGLDLPPPPPTTTATQGLFLPQVPVVPPTLDDARRALIDPLGPPMGLDPFASPGPLPPLDPEEFPPEDVLSQVQPLDLLSSANLADVATPLLPRPPRLGEAPNATPLALEEVLASAEQTYPPFLENLQELSIASGQLLSALGAFDLDLNVDARNWPLGFYQRYLYDAFVQQFTPYWGTTFFAGYRLGLGNWPIYFQNLDTLPGGAFVAGFELPLLRNGRIDPRRARIWQAEIARRQVEPAISRQRIELIRNATRAYWLWVAAGQSFLVYERLLQIAELRNLGIQRQVELGLVSPLVLVDNQRVVLQRQALLLAAKRRFQQVSLELSLFLRDRYSLPVIPAAERLPARFPGAFAPDESRLPEDLETALRLRPEIRELQLLSEKINVDRDLATNQLLPQLNLYVYAEQNIGALPPIPTGGQVSSVVSAELVRNKEPFILESSLLFEVPLQRRQARGRLQVADSQIRQVGLRMRFAGDQIVINVKDAVAALDASHGQMIRYQQAVEANRRLEIAERRRFELGLSTLLVVALREQATADAQSQAIDAAALYFEALADYRAALGIDAMPPGFSQPPPSSIPSSRSHSGWGRAHATNP